MSDTRVCSNCAATVSAAATFCTSCGHNLAAEPPAAEAASTPTGWTPLVGDQTQVTMPGLSDHTQAYPAAAPPPTPPASSAPWSPASQTAPPAPAAPGAWAPPGPSAPAAPPAPTTPAGPPTSAAPGHAYAPAATWASTQGTTTGAPPTTWPTPAPASAGPTRKGSPLGGVLAAAGAVATLVGVFTAWVTFNTTYDDLSGWDLTSGKEVLKSNDPYILLGLGVAALILSAVLFTGVLGNVGRGLAIVAGLAVIGICVRDWLSIADAVKSEKAFEGLEQSYSFGFWLTIVGGALTAVAGLMPSKKS